jgi:hypothetical protein
MCFAYTDNLRIGMFKIETSQERMAQNKEK